MTAHAARSHHGDLGTRSDPGRSPGGGNGNPLQHSCLQSPMDTHHYFPSNFSIKPPPTLRSVCRNSSRKITAGSQDGVQSQAWPLGGTPHTARGSESQPGPRPARRKPILPLHQFSLKDGNGTSYFLFKAPLLFCQDCISL